MGSDLQEIVNFTTGMDAQVCFLPHAPSSIPLMRQCKTRGLALTSSPFLRTAHNALTPPSAVSLDGLIPKDQREKEDAYHFVVYLPFAGECVRAGWIEEGSDKAWGFW